MCEFSVTILKVLSNKHWLTEFMRMKIVIFQLYQLPYLVLTHGIKLKLGQNNICLFPASLTSQLFLVKMQQTHFNVVFA